MVTPSNLDGRCVDYLATGHMRRSSASAAIRITWEVAGFLAFFLPEHGMEIIRDPSNMKQECLLLCCSDVRIDRFLD